MLLENGTSHFDARPVSLVGTATLEWCARELGVDADRRRLRTNLILETAEPFEEEAWVGRELEIGGVGSRSSSASNAAAPSTWPRTAWPPRPRG